MLDSQSRGRWFEPRGGGGSNSKSRIDIRRPLAVPYLGATLRRPGRRKQAKGVTTSQTWKITSVATLDILVSPEGYKKSLHSKKNVSGKLKFEFNNKNYRLNEHSNNSILFHYRILVYFETKDTRNVFK